MATSRDEAAEDAPAPAGGPATGAVGLPQRGRTGLLAVGALGVVYGDIGTNPLFAMREAFDAHHLPLTEDNVIGLLSLMVWSLIVVISLKYLSFVMRADNDGEGGILALTTLAARSEGAGKGRRRALLVLLGLFGAALLYGDGVVTPSISVLAAVEGTTIAAPGLDHLVVPMAVAVLVLLFSVQHRGTAAIGRAFGPVMVVWFTTIGVLGAVHVVDRPGVLRAVNPVHSVRFFVDNGFDGFLVLGAVILVVVGGEALYADLGHFGRRPITVGWYALVLPSLVAVYMGQGALLLAEPDAIENPFYRLAPDWALVPLVVLATLATVIASQALISGAFSLTSQAIQLGYSPRLRVRHTSAHEIGQVYIPAINYSLLVVCVALVVGFRESAGLAAAYGMAVTTTMVLTTIAFAVVARHTFRWSPAKVAAICGAFLVVDLGFFGATLFKIPHGGWVPLVLGALVFTVLTTWRTGRRLVQQRLRSESVPLDRFVEDLGHTPPVRTEGAVAHMTVTPGMTPVSLLRVLRAARSLPAQVLIVTVVTENVPRVHRLRRATLTDKGRGIYQVVLHIGFMEPPDVPRALAERVVMRLGVDLATMTYIVGRESAQVSSGHGMARWRKRLFAVLSRNATPASVYLRLPPDQTVELRVPVEL